jgi:TRAP-type C4-dicarboxylate transport system permease small subunit
MRDMVMFNRRIRASQVTRIISGTLVTVVAGFSLVFSYVLYQLVGELNAVGSAFGSPASLMYLAVEGIFLASILFAAFAVVRKRNGN